MISNEPLGEPLDPMASAACMAICGSISVTDRCNIRCFYCMPDTNVQFKPRSELLTFEEIERFVRVVAPMGIHKLRLTGGEPLVRHELSKSWSEKSGSRVPGIDDIAYDDQRHLAGRTAALEH